MNSHKINPIANATDVTVEDWSEPKAVQYGAKVAIRFSHGILRSNAIAKMTNIKTGL